MTHMICGFGTAAPTGMKTYDTNTFELMYVVCENYKNYSECPLLVLSACC